MISLRQQGVALVIVMIFTVLLALSALTSAKLAVMEERLAGNIHHRIEALAAGEAGIAASLGWLNTHHANCTPGQTTATAVLDSGAHYTATVMACLEDKRIVIRSVGRGADGAASCIIEAIYVPPVGVHPGRYDAWREIVL